MFLRTRYSPASEVERSELALESTRRNLENVQQEMKMKERELLAVQEKYDEVSKQLKSSCIRVEELETKVEDLKLQVRHELLKNETIERDMEMMPRLRDEVAERDKKIEVFQKLVEEKSALLTASRMSKKEYKDRIRNLQKQVEEMQKLKEELDLAKNEVNTLIQLMSGKDILVQQKCHVLDQVKMVIGGLQVSSNDDEETPLKTVQHMLDTLKLINMVITDNERSREKAWLQAFSKSCSLLVDENINRRRSSKVTSTNYNNENIQGQGKTNHLSGYKNNNKTSASDGSVEGFHNSSQGINGTSKQSHTEKSVLDGSNSFTQSTSFHQNNHLIDPSVSTISHATTSVDNEESPVILSKSQKFKKQDATIRRTLNQHRNMANVYRTEHAKHAKYQPSLDYAIGINADEEHLTNASHYSSEYHNLSIPLSNQHHGFNTKLNVGNESRSFITPKKNCSYSSFVNNTKISSQDSRCLPESVATRLNSQQLTASQTDLILCSIIQNGDRVSITVTQKPPRYGHKKSNPVTYTGIVKYKGFLDKCPNDTNIYVGVKLDAPLGESDGTYQGRRYMFTPPGHTKFFKIQDLDSMLDILSGKYIHISELIHNHQDIPPVPELKQQL